MKWVAMTVSFALTVAASIVHASAQTYDPDLFTVSSGRECYVFCPAGDVPVSFCISYNGQPFAAPPSEVWLKLECLGGGLILWADAADKSAYYRSAFYSGHPCESEYWWRFLASGCCEDAKISFHMWDDPTPFYEFHARIATFDINKDGAADAIDSTCIADAWMGSGCDLASPSCFDMTCDGTIDQWDLWWAIGYLCGPLCAMGHMDHTYLHPLETRETSWGAIKALYR